MATQTVVSHTGLDRVLNAYDALVVLVKAAFRESRALAAQQRNDERLMEVARTDSRLMADLRAAKARAERDLI